MQSLGSVFGGVTYWSARVRRWSARIVALPLRVGAPHSARALTEAVHEAEAGAVFDCTIALTSCVDLIAFVEEDDGSLAVPIQPHEVGAVAIFVRTGIDTLEELVLAAEATMVPNQTVNARGVGDPSPTEASNLLFSSMINVLDAQNHLRQIWQQLSVCGECQSGPSSWETPGYCTRCKAETERRFLDPMGGANGAPIGAH